MEKTIKTIILRKQKIKNGISQLKANIKDNGDLQLEGYDIGDFVEKFWGDDDYEFWLTIKKEYKDTILLWLIKERFTSDVVFRNWLEKKDIPNQFCNWV